MSREGPAHMLRARVEAFCTACERVWPRQGLGVCISLLQGPLPPETTQTPPPPDSQSPGVGLASAAPHTPHPILSPPLLQSGLPSYGAPQPCRWEPPCPAECQVVSQVHCVALVPPNCRVYNTRHVIGTLELPTGRWAFQTRSQFR